MSRNNSFYGESFGGIKTKIAEDFISETTEVVQMVYLMPLGDLFCCNTYSKFHFKTC
jgi:hypothetical protein